MIAWEESGSGVPLVLVHGLTENRRTWDTVVPHLEDSFRCVRLDLRGHGESSDADDYSGLAMADDVAVVVSEAGLTHPVLIGHSLGAVVATAYASREPTRGVVNVDQPMRFGDFAAAIQPMADVLRGPAFPEAVLAAFGALDEVPTGARALLDDLHANARKDVVLGVWALVLDTPPDELNALAEEMLRPLFAAPYLSIHGDADLGDYPAWLRSQLRRVEIESGWPGGHYPHLADPARFAARVKEWAIGEDRLGI